MADPQIRYTRMESGISLAYWTMGSGRPVIITPPMGFSHIQLELEDRELRPWYERLARKYMIVRFDLPAHGLSQRHLTSAQFLTTRGGKVLDAVEGALSLERADIIGCGSIGFAACDYAAERPDRVGRLVLWTVPPDGEDWGSDEVKAAIIAGDHDWRTFTETFAHAVLGWSQTERAREWASLMRKAMSWEDWRTLSAVSLDNPAPDAAGVLAQVSAPTLVMYPSGGRNVSNEAAQKLTSSIRNARLVLVPFARGTIAPSTDEATLAIESFLDEGTAAPMALTQQSGTTVILFADIVDSTALTEQIGDRSFREKARSLDERLRAAIGAAGGNAIDGKLLGDGVLAVFPAASQAIDAALGCVRACDGTELQLHLGIHAGDVIREEGNVFGGAVNIASRISGMSAAGEVLVSRTVRDLARTSAGVVFEDRGEHALKGIAEAVRMYAVRTAGGE